MTAAAGGSNNHVKNKKSLIHFRGTLKNNFFTNNPHPHSNEQHLHHPGNLTLNTNDSNTISNTHLHGLDQQQMANDSLDSRGRIGSG
jgi:hypothetical protein